MAHPTPSQILKKRKAASSKGNAKDKDDSKGSKGPRRNAILDFIARNKSCEDDD